MRERSEEAPAAGGRWTRRRREERELVDLFFFVFFAISPSLHKGKSTDEKKKEAWFFFSRSFLAILSILGWLSFSGNFEGNVRFFSSSSLRLSRWCKKKKAETDSGYFVKKEAEVFLSLSLILFFLSFVRSSFSHPSRFPRVLLSLCLSLSFSSFWLPSLRF